MQQLLLLLFAVLLTPFSTDAQEIDKSLLKGYDAAFVFYCRSSGETISVDTLRSAQRLAPCSTFKIYNTLIGLELGLIKGPDDHWYTWDGVRRGYEAWNKDMSLREAFRVSAVPAYQILARRIGHDRMKTYIGNIGYGTGDISSGIDTFWLPREGKTSITISADEQVALLNRLLDGKLPFSEKNISILRDIMKVTETSKGTLYGKTGSGMDVEGKWNLGWFTGFVESGGEVYVFACNITGGENPSGIVAREIVEDVLKAKWLL
ncbi:MAG: class D beta-lactamase [Chlorobium phaeobacteroides]|uniref:beta-lactamase n=1 Tax=Chlorobium phaeobacteroides (strain BS1) TaxID=331678 RepID=B3EQ59_CHLPB|nr:class D beta-lactamase [Chlorobium phaeobacteroides]